LQYLGQWYEAERYFALFEFAGKCVSANYTDMGEGRINIINRQTSSL
jgi:lipocalin